MHYSENGIYRISDAAFKRWNSATDSINKSIADKVGLNKWTPLVFDNIGRVVKLKLENGTIIESEAIKDEIGYDLSCLFTVSELEGGVVVHVGMLEEVKPSNTDDRYVVFEISQFIKPAPVSKAGKSIFTLEEAKEIILELTDIVPETTRYELFKSSGLAEVKTIKTVEVSNV